MYALSDYTLENYKLPPGVRSIKDYDSAYGSSLTPSITCPLTTKSGDLIIVFCGSNYTQSTAPSGFDTLIKTSPTVYHNMGLYSKISDGSEAGSTLTITNSGNQQWNIWVVLISNNPTIDGYNGTSATSGTTRTTGNADAKLGDLVLIFGSARVGSKTLTSDYGDVVYIRNADASLSSGFWQARAGATTVAATIRSPASTSGMSAGVVTIG